MFCVFNSLSKGGWDNYWLMELRAATATTIGCCETGSKNVDYCYYENSNHEEYVAFR